MMPSIAYITNTPSPHQMPLGLNLFRIIGDKFRMVFMNPINNERKSLGWRDPDIDLKWIIPVWKSENNKKILNDILEKYDVVIYGAVPAYLLFDRLRAGKLTFRYMERPFKRGIIMGFPWWFKRFCNEFWPFDYPNHHLLATGAYCAKDLSRIRMFNQRQWKWGYFTPVSDTFPPVRLNHPVKILWAGRMLDWKRIDLLLNATYKLHHSGKKFKLTLVGDGPEKNHLLQYSERYKMQEYVTFIPPVTIDNVLKLMCSSHIYVMPSSYYEGWGAVINEAMASGCCVVSSYGPGAAPWLIEHGKSGYLFPDGDIQELCLILSTIIDNHNICREIGLNAWSNIKNIWSPEVAAERLVNLVSGLLGTCPLPKYSVGPCSRA